MQGEKLHQAWDWPQLMSCDQDRHEQFHSKQISIVHEKLENSPA